MYIVWSLRYLWIIELWSKMWIKDFLGQRRGAVDPKIYREFGLTHRKVPVFPIAHLNNKMIVKLVFMELYTKYLDNVVVENILYKRFLKMFSGFLMLISRPSYHTLGIPIVKKILNLKININSEPPLWGTKIVQRS